jgi:hypothetical protein
MADNRSRHGWRSSCSLVYNGAVFLNGSNSIGSSVEMVGGLLAVGNGGALRNGAVLLYGGELLATTTETTSEHGFRREHDRRRHRPEIDA